MLLLTATHIIMINIKEDKRSEFFNEKAIPAAQQNVFATHSSKVSETYSSFFAICDETKNPLGFNYLCTATCGSNSMDICTHNATYKNVQAFLSATVKEKSNKTVLQLLKENDSDLREEIEKYTDNYDEIRKAMLSIPKATMPTKTDAFLKQVFFPVNNENNGYHLLSVLQSSLLVEQVNKVLSKSSISKIRNSAMSGNVAGTTGSYLMSKNGSPFCFYSLSPQSIKKNLHKALKNEYLLPDFDIDDLPGVHNGMLVDESLLETIIKEGIRKGAGHWLPERDRAERKYETVLAFLGKYGYDAQPIGYELHHIVPISQGGADVIENLILLSETDHQKVTDKHNEVFKWHTYA